MAAEDITGKETLIPGVNAPNNYVRSEARLIDGDEFPGILAVEKHDIFVIPKGNMLVGLKVVALKDTESSGSATVQFKAKIGASSEAVHTAIGKADLAAGDVSNIPVTKIKAYDANSDTVVQMTVGTAALTALKLFVVAEYIPVTAFMTAG